MAAGDTGWRRNEDVAEGFEEGGAVVGDACYEAVGGVCVDGRGGARRGRGGRVRGEEGKVGSCEIDVGVQGMRAVKRRGAFVALDVVFLFCGDVVGVAVCGAAKHDKGRGCGGREDGVCGRGGKDRFPAAAGHGGSFAWGNDDEELADTKELNVNDIGGPEVRGSDFANVKENGFWVVTSELGLGGGGEEVADKGPEGVCVGGPGIVLFEVEGAWTIGGACSEGVTEGSRAGGDSSAVGKGEGVVGEVVEDMERFDCRAGNRGGCGGEGVVEGFGGGKLAATDFVAARGALVFLTEMRAAAVARFIFAAAGAVFEIALLAGAVFAVGS